MARKDQGGGERPRIAAEGGRIVGVQLNQPGYLLFGVGMNVQERQHPAADPRHRQTRETGGWQTFKEV
jgi:hypothetical protein